MALHRLRAAATLTSLAAGRWSDRAGATRVLSVGVGAFGIAYTGFTRDTTTWTVLLPWFLLAGIGIGCAETAQHTAVATHAPDRLRGSAFGLLAGIQSLATSPAAPSPDCSGPPSAQAGPSPTSPPG